MTTNVAYLPGTVPMWTFAERVRKVRRDQGLTQAAFAESLAVGEKAYAAWESGKNEPTSIVDIAVKLEQVTGVPRQWFLGWMDNTPGPNEGPEGDVSGRRDSNSQHSACNADGSVIELFPAIQHAVAA